jgi:ATP-dependent RNA helicase RhlE
MTHEHDAEAEEAVSSEGFAGLGVVAQLVRALERMGAETPTRPQRAGIPPALAGRDLAVVAHTGTGKTLAYLVPLAQRLLAEPPQRTRGRPVDPRRRLRALVLCPTRELAQQVAREAQALLRGSVLRAGAVYGKSALGPQQEMVRKGVDLLVGTPGRVRELCDLDALSLAFVRQAVLDEADRMLDMGFLPQVKDLLARAPADRQLLFFTATLPRPVEALVQEFLRDPVRRDLSRRAPAAVTGTPNPRVDAGQRLHAVEDERKAALTVALVKDGNRRGVVVFCRTRRRAGWVAAALRAHEIRTALLHGDRSQRQRQQALDMFARGDARVLVATDVAARGLHVPVVRTVVNYDVPLLPEEYVHRIGRAGHGGGHAEAITLLCPADAERWARVERVARVRVEATPAPAHDAYMKARLAAAPDTERIPPARRRASEAPKMSESAVRSGRGGAEAPPTLAAIIRRGRGANATNAPRGGKGAGGRGNKASGAARSPSGGRSGAKAGRRGTQRRRPLGAGQKPGKGAGTARRADR